MFIKHFKGSNRQKQNTENWLLKLEGAKFKYNTLDEHSVYNGLPKTRGFSEVGHVGSGMVLDFGTL
jgi:hypothetical protein